MAGSPSISEQIAAAKPNPRTLEDLIREQYPDLDSKKKLSTYSRTGNVITVTIYQAAVPAPRMTQADRWKKRPCVLRYRAWRDVVKAAFREIPAPETVETIAIRCYFLPPESWPKKKRHEVIGERHRQMPDRDNIEKGICDALWKRDDKLGGCGENAGKWWAYEDKTVIEIVLVSS